MQGGGGCMDQHSKKNTTQQYTHTPGIPSPNLLVHIYAIKIKLILSPPRPDCCCCAVSLSEDTFFTIISLHHLHLWHTTTDTHTCLCVVQKKDRKIFCWPKFRGLMDRYHLGRRQPRWWVLPQFLSATEGSSGHTTSPVIHIYGMWPHSSQP